MMNRAAFESALGAWEDKQLAAHLGGDDDDDGWDGIDPSNWERVEGGESPSAFIPPAEHARAIDEFLGEIVGRERERGESLADFHARVYEELRRMAAAWLDN